MLFLTIFEIASGLTDPRSLRHVSLEESKSLLDGRDDNPLTLDDARSRRGQGNAPKHAMDGAKPNIVKFIRSTAGHAPARRSDPLNARSDRHEKTLVWSLLEKENDFSGRIALGTS
jgi:hypothetical protein